MNPPKCTCAKKDAVVACSICKQKAYCSEQCEKMGWSIHSTTDCNVHYADKPDTTIFTPQIDFDENRIEGNEEFLQSHIVRYMDAKANVHEQVIEAQFRQTLTKFGGGAEVSEEKKYQLSIGGELINVVPVFKGAKNTRADHLAENKSADMSKVVFWSPDRTNIEIPTTGSLKIVLLVDGEKLLKIAGDYKLPTSETLFGNWSRKIKSALLQKEYEAKGFKKNMTNTLLTMRGSNRKGNTFRFTVQMTKGQGGSISVPIVDAEFSCRLADLERAEKKMAPPPVPEADAELAFKCDSSDIDHVSALVLALEDKMAAGELANFDAHFNVISAHRQALMVGGDVTVSPKVRLSVHTAVEELIKLSLADRARDKIARVKFLRNLKKMTSDAEFQAEYDKWISQSNVLRAQGAVATTSLENARAVDLEARRRGFALKLQNYQELQKGSKDARAAKKGK